MMKISICIPVYNVTLHFLKATVDSVLQQKNNFELEIVVSDDASRFNYTEIIKYYPSELVKFYRNDVNLGMVGNWNIAVKRSSGDFILLLGHDDILKPGMFNVYLKEFKSHSDVVLCSCGREFINENNETIILNRAVNDRSNIFIKKDKYVISYKDIAKLCFRNGNAIGEPSAVMFRRDVYEKVKGYDPLFEHAADVDFILSVSKHGKVVYFNHPFLMRRIHKENLTKKNILLGKVSKDRVRLFEKFHKDINFSKKEISSFRAYLVAKSVYDFYRSILAHQIKLSLYSIKTICKYLDFSPFIYAKYIKEIVTRKNNDAM